jgi:hypothetical protein
MRRSLPIVFLSFVALAGLAACGGKSEDVPLDGDGGGDGDGGDGDGDGGGTPDAVVGGDCGADKPQCNNCMDDDRDGLADGFDPECTGVMDDDEGSFATGIPGDNIDAKKQDCFFDGNSGADGTGGHGQISTCCLLADGECPTALGGDDKDGVGNFDRKTDCEYNDDAVEECAALTPPGCDCFGCCTVCVEAGCFDVLGNATVAAGCNQETVGTDDCLECIKQEVCTGGECNAEEDDCVLCPGETAEDLPKSCEVNECPGDATPCTSGGSECSDIEYCQAGCCVAAVP